MVRALMQWRRQLNRSLEDELDTLDYRRDLFVEEVSLASASGEGQNGNEIEEFGEWLFEERRRLLRVTELRCEECWRKAMMARDDKERTPLHWEASGQ